MSNHPGPPGPSLAPHHWPTDAADWPWSSAKAHLLGRDDRLVRVAPMLSMIADWRGFLNSAIPEEELRDLREHNHTGCPLGSVSFVAHLGASGATGRPNSPPAKSRSAIEITQTAIIGSCPPNPNRLLRLGPGRLLFFRLLMSFHQKLLAVRISNLNLILVLPFGFPFAVYLDVEDSISTPFGCCIHCSSSRDADICPICKRTIKIKKH